MKKKTKLLFSFFTFLFFFLAGCAQQNYYVQVNDDDSVNFAIELTIPEKAMEKISSLHIQREAILESKKPLFQPLESYFKEKGFSYDFEESKEQIKVSMQKKYLNASEFNQEIRQLYEEKHSGLGLSIDRNRSIAGVKTKYSGVLKFVFDEDLENIMKQNPHLKEFLQEIPITAYLTIYDDNRLVSTTSLEANDNEYRLMTTGDYDFDAQNKKDFSLVTNEKNQVFAISVFIGGSILVLVLLLIVFGKKSNLPRFGKGKDHV